MFVRRMALMSQASKVIVAIVASAIGSGCATAARNPALDKYPAGVTGRTSVVYYDVHGRTFAEIAADMRKQGPKINGTSYVGETRSPMHWSFRTASMMGASCEITDIQLSVNAQILLPRWTPAADAEPGLAAEWTRFIAALETHEAGHKDISAKAGRDIMDQLRGLSGLCSQISTRANDLARRIVDRASDAQVQYDADTRHGLTQGTSFGGPRRGTNSLNASDAQTLIVGPRPGTVLIPLTASVDRAWATLPAAYAALQLTINASDSSAHAAGDTATVRGKFGTVPLAEILDCGALPPNVNSDSMDVAVFLTSHIDPPRMALTQPHESEMTNTVQAVAHPAGAPAIACRSRGTLERQLGAAMRAALAR